MPLADSACEAAIRALPRAAWKLAGEDCEVDRGDEAMSETGGDGELAAPNEIDRRPSARGFAK